MRSTTARLVRRATSFEQVLRDNLAQLGSTVTSVGFAPDDPQLIAAEIRKCLDNGAELIVTSGGMSVDPDDVTRLGIKEAGAEAEKSSKIDPMTASGAAEHR